MWFVAVPAIVLLILFLPHRSHLALSVLVVVSSALGARELAALFVQKDAGYRASWIIIPLIGAALPLTQLLINQDVLGPESEGFLLYAVPALVLLLQVARRDTDGFRHALTNGAANTLLLLYPGLFLSYVVRIGDHPRATALLLLLLCMVFFNDTVAYLAGMLYRSVRSARAAKAGREWTPRLVLPVSPNKTLVGFAAGLLTSPVTFLLGIWLFPAYLDFGVSAAIGVGLAVGAATIAGDLIESALKRSATQKDSGTIIPGRGGILDSIDSVLYAAPVFYYLLRYLI